MTDASLATRFAVNDFRVGRVLNRIVSVLSRNFLTFFIVALVVYLPILLVSQDQTSPAPGQAVGQVVALALLAVFLWLVLSTLSQAIILYAAFQAMRGRPVNLVESFKVGLRRFFPIIGLAISMGVALMFGFMLLIIPGVILAMVWSVATPACVVEKLGPFRSMGRSAALTRGHRWKILGLFLLLGIMGAAGGSMLTAVLYLLGGNTLVQIGSLLWNGVWGAVYAVALVVTYHDLRVAKEGVDIEQIAAVFD
jgi:hypothetical protein